MGGTGNECVTGLRTVVEASWELSEVDSSRGLEGNMGVSPGVGEDGSDAIYVRQVIKCVFMRASFGERRCPHLHFHRYSDSRACFLKKWC